MTDEELAYWGEFGRRLTPGLGNMTPAVAHDMFALWNAFGALERKVRDGE